MKVAVRDYLLRSQPTRIQRHERAIIRKGQVSEGCLANETNAERKRLTHETPIKHAPTNTRDSSLWLQFRAVRLNERMERSYPSKADSSVQDRRNREL